MEPHDSQKHPGTSGLVHLTTEELFERLRKANEEPTDPNKQSLTEYINGQEENDGTGHTLSETLRHAIVNSELSQYRIAKESGVGAGILARFVNGERELKLDTADKICKVLGLQLTKIET